MADRLKLSNARARRMALAAQGFADPRPTGKVDRRHLRRAIDRMGLIQIDSVNVLVRSQELPLFARLGPHPRTLIPDAVDDGELFEYWVHMASIVPSAHHHLYRWRMGRMQVGNHRGLLSRRPEYVEEVLAMIRDAGPVTAADLAQRTGPKGSWWDWDDGKIALEHLFEVGALSARRRGSDFARVYDLTERVIPAAALALPAPPETEARKELIVMAARSLGVGTVHDLSDYHRQKLAVVKQLVAELVEDGRLIEADVEGWDNVGYVHPDAKVPRRIGARALLSPFDPVVWFRDRGERLFGFHYRIEIYVPPAKRRYGYYVLPFLLDDELVARVDLKADRQSGTLLVQSAWGEPGIHEPEVAHELTEELASMAGWLGLDRVTVVGRGDLSPALARSVAAATPIATSG